MTVRVGHKRFPPQGGRLLLPSAGRRAALAGLTMYRTSRWSGRAVRLGGGLLIWLGGPRLLPGRARDSSPLDGLARGAEIRELLLSHHGWFDGEAVQLRRQQGRLGATVLLTRHGQPWLFVKVTAPAAAEREFLALQLISAQGSAVFVAPEAVSLHPLGELSLLVTEPVPVRRHDPFFSVPISSIVAAVQEGLSDLPRPEGTHPGWMPGHGDLTPWNLRRRRQQAFLFDWEHVAYQPPLADELYFYASCAALGRRVERPRGDAAEAAGHWISVLEPRADSPLRSAMLRVFLEFGADPESVPGGRSASNADA